MNIFGLIANFLSGSRFLIPVVLFSNFIQGGIKDKLFVAILLASTDLIDGLTARLAKKEGTDLGKLLDHLSDKVAIISFAYFLGSKGIISWYVLLPVMLSEFMVFIVSSEIVHRTGNLVVEGIGKRKMIFFFLSILFVWAGLYFGKIFIPIAYIFILFGTIYSIFSFVNYKNISEEI